MKKIIIVEKYEAKLRELNENIEKCRNTSDVSELESFKLFFEQIIEDIKSID